MTPDGPVTNIHEWLNWWLHNHTRSNYAVLYPPEVRRAIEEHDEVLDSRDELRGLLLEKVQSDPNCRLPFFYPGSWEWRASRVLGQWQPEPEDESWRWL